MITTKKVRTRKSLVKAKYPWILNSKNAITAKHYYYKTKDLIVRGAQCIYMLGNCALLHDTIIKWLLYCSLFQTRYEKFLVCVKNNRSDALHILQPKAMTEWERERERVRNRVFFCLVWKHLCTFKLELEKHLSSLLQVAEVALPLGPLLFFLFSDLALGLSSPLDGKTWIWVTELLAVNISTVPVSHSKLTLR